MRFVLLQGLRFYWHLFENVERFSLHGLDLLAQVLLDCVLHGALQVLLDDLLDGSVVVLFGFGLFGFCLLGHDFGERGGAQI